MTSRRIPKHLQQSLFGCVVEFMSDSGLSESAIRGAFESCLTKQKKKLMSRESAAGRYLQSADLSAGLLRMWHRDGRYIDSNAKPRPLHLEEGRNSLRSMALKLDQNVDVESFLQFLVSSGLIQKSKDGRYLPATEAGAISRNNRFVNEHVTKSIIRFISTVGRNTRPNGDADQVLERFAYVADLNGEDVREFCEFTKAQGHSYLQVVDDWMEQRRVRPASRKVSAGKKGVVAGVHVIAYVGEAKDRGRQALLGVSKGKGSEGSDTVRGRAASAR